MPYTWNIPGVLIGHERTIDRLRKKIKHLENEREDLFAKLDVARTTLQLLADGQFGVERMRLIREALERLNNA